MPGVTMNNVTHALPHPSDSDAASPPMDHDMDPDTDSMDKPKKKRRVVKTSDKKYECPQPDCGKSYSRAEHLYRHQLNHTPKQIYHCDFPGCDRHFVRADLCARHKERHTAKGSHLQRKDAFMHSQRGPASAEAPMASLSSAPAAAPANPQSPVDSAHPAAATSRPHHSAPYMSPHASAAAHPAQSYASHNSTTGSVYSIGANHVNAEAPPSHTNGSAAVGAPLQHHPHAYAPTYTAVNSYPAHSSAHPHAPSSPSQSSATMAAAPRYKYDTNGIYDRAPAASNAYPRALPVNHLHDPPPASAHSNGPSSLSPHLSSRPMYAPPHSHHYSSPTSDPTSAYRPPTSNYTSLPSLPPFGVPQGSYGTPASARQAGGMPPHMGASIESYQVSNPTANAMMDFSVMDQFNPGYAMPVFGTEGFNRSPPTALDMELFNQLLENSGLDLSMPSPPPFEHPLSALHPSAPLPKIEAAEPAVSGPPDTWETKDAAPEDHKAAQNASDPFFDLDLRECKVTETKQTRLLDMLKSFDDVQESAGRRSLKSDIFAGDLNDAHHPLSVTMLQTYLTSYWIHIHQQMPILHRPTFNAETCPDLLLLAMMCLGACCLERIKTDEQIAGSAEVAYFAAYHIRWQVFKDAEFRPTAKLWTFQTMLLLELFEKMYSTRILHERAHIHHATTLTVMRRGSSLVGRSANESSSGTTDPTRTPPGPDGSINTSGQNTHDAFWNRWITAEATRRVAFAAFVIDSTHATLFGHSAVMSPHDMRLPLPCDEALWSATSSAEVQRVEASLAANGFKPTSFLEGLKKTLNGQKVRTNTFGRVVLMAGLLNVSWQMNQRDLQVQSLGANNTLGNPTRWRSPLTRAFDFWRRDFDESLAKNDHWLQVCQPGANDRNSIHQRDSTFESRTCLHSLAHMAMHADIVECEVFAGAARALGRTVSDADRTLSPKRMREWAPSARARDAVFYALRFLCEVLIPDEDLSPGRRSNPQPTPHFSYSARDDYLLNRPWILYFACIIVWSYGYALDGAIQQAPATLPTRDLQVADMQRFLIRVGGVASPGDLEHLTDRNACLGLLMLLRQCFKEPRWELLHEASDMLGLCVDLLVPDAKPANGHARDDGHSQA